MDDLILNDKFEWFDQARFDRRPNKDSNDWEIFLPNGTYIQLQDLSVGLLNSKAGKKYYTAIPKDSYFMLRKVYYPNGKIWTKGWAYIDFFAKGVWPNFDEDGNLAFKYDWDAPFTFTFEDVLKFCQKNNIKVEKSTGEWVYGYTTTIKREADEDRAAWAIEYLKRWDLIETIYLDGKTGKIIRRDSIAYRPD